jgi:pSer/pThr/pTyr-binding forkhead associated (FHA) protein
MAEGSSLTLGRGSNNSVVVADTAVSRRHATLQVAAGRCWVRDEASTNGTFVNGQRVATISPSVPFEALEIGEDPSSALQVWEIAE